jgi:hypothetical protein
VVADWRKPFIVRCLSVPSGNGYEKGTSPIPGVFNASTSLDAVRIPKMPNNDANSHKLWRCSEHRQMARKHLSTNKNEGCRPIPL